MAISIENQNTFNAAIEKGISLFLGSGFSVLAEDRLGRRLPVGSELKDELIKEFDRKDIAALSLAQICSIIESEQKQKFLTYLIDRFQVVAFSPQYDALTRLHIPTILTTNIDDLVPQIFAASDQRFINDLTRRGPGGQDEHRVDYVPLHGSVSDPDRQPVMAELDIAVATTFDPDLWNVLARRLQDSPILFWGYSLQDAGVLRTLHPATISGRSHNDKWILLRERDEAFLQLIRSYGFQYVIGSTEELLVYLAGVAGRRPTKVGVDAPTKAIFPHDAVPTDIAGPVRPIVEFYRGAAPTWFDIRQGKIHRTEYARSVVDSINSGGHTFITGLDATGKTTLLMQVAWDCDFRGHKLFVDDLSPEKAKYIVNRLQGARALVFIDNLYGYVDGLMSLAETPGIQVVAAERTYHFDNVYHTLRGLRPRVIDVTALSQRDLQTIVDSIPAQIKKAYVQPTSLAGEADPSIFETIEANISSPRLRQRFQSTVRHMEENDQELHDLFVMCCYTHVCRTPVSTDMALSFLSHRSRNIDYTRFYHRMEQLKNYVVDYTDPVIDEDQDHFVARSLIMAETIVDLASSASFRRVLEHFHFDMSPLRVVGFDVFKRRGFDHHFVRKAYGEWHAGKSFYDRLYRRDRSPYLLQHCALYLHEKGRSIDAFEYIDKAMVQSEGRIFSIRNSYAYILFRNNIQFSGTKPEVRKTLRESLDILLDCVKFDGKRSYHIIMLADHCADYFRAYGDAEAKRYLEEAGRLVAQEVTEAPWNRRLVRVHERVSRALR